MDFCSSFNSNSIFKSFKSLEMAPSVFIFESNIDRESLLRVVWKSCDTICLWKWPPIWYDLGQCIWTSENGIKAWNVTVFSLFTLRERQYLSICSVILCNHKNSAIGYHNRGAPTFKREGTNAKRQTEVNNRFLKSAWRHSVIDYYNKARNTPYFAPWHLGDNLSVYRWPQCTIRRGFTNITADYQCFRLASAIGHWPIKTENGRFWANCPARLLLLLCVSSAYR